MGHKGCLQFTAYWAWYQQLLVATGLNIKGQVSVCLSYSGAAEFVYFTIQIWDAKLGNIYRLSITIARLH
jgi:hypothetical protein